MAGRGVACGDSMGISCSHPPLTWWANTLPSLRDSTSGGTSIPW